MALKSQYQVAVVNDLDKTQTGVTIPQSGQVSSILACAGTSPTGLIAPASFTQANVSFRVSKTSTGNADATGISGVTVTAPGSGYTDPQAVTFTSGSGSGAAANAVLGYAIDSIAIDTAGSYASMPAVTATIGTGAVLVTKMAAVSASVANVGSLYNVGDTITLAGGTFTTAVQLTVATGLLLATNLNAAGSGYAVGDTITLAGGTFTTAAVITVNTVTSGAIATFSITSAGSYTVPPGGFTQGSTSGSGTGATFSGTIFGVRSVTISNPGLYTVLPSSPVSQSATSGSGTGATFNLNWGLSAITVSAGGNNYEQTSAVNITGGGGTGGGSATIELAATGIVKRVEMVSEGSGYLTPPTVAFTSLTGSGATGVAIVRDFGDFVPLTNFDGTDFFITVRPGMWIPLLPSMFNSVLFLQLFCDTQQSSACTVDFALAPIYQGIHA